QRLPETPSSTPPSGPTGKSSVRCPGAAPSGEPQTGLPWRLPPVSAGSNHGFHALHHFFIVPHKSLGNLQQRFAHGFHGGFNFPRRGLFDTLKLLAHSGACVIRRPLHVPVQGIRRLTDRPAYLRHHRLGLLSYPLHHSAV